MHFAGNSSGHDARMWVMARKRRKLDPDLRAPVPLVQNRGRPSDPRRKCPVEIRECRRHGKTEWRSLAAFREEMKKCVLVCANCHGEIESGLIESPPAGVPTPRWKALLGRKGKPAA
jgi:hypothetical protein